MALALWSLVLIFFYDAQITIILIHNFHFQNPGVVVIPRELFTEKCLIITVRIGWIYQHNNIVSKFSQI